MKNEWIKTTPSTYLDVVQDGCVILEPRSSFDGGIIGYSPSENKLVYSYNLLVDSLMDAWKCEYTEAVEYLDYNTIYVSVENWPVFVFDGDEDEE